MRNEPYLVISDRFVLSRWPTIESAISAGRRAMGQAKVVTNWAYSFRPCELHVLVVRESDGLVVLAHAESKKKPPRNVDVRLLKPVDLR